MRFLVLKMVNLKKIIRLVSLSMLGTIGTLLILVNPTLGMLALLGMFTVLTLARDMNFYKVVMMFKRYAREASRLRFEIRMKLHTGWKDYNAALDDETRSRCKIVSCF